MSIKSVIGLSTLMVCLTIQLTSLATPIKENPSTFNDQDSISVERRGDAFQKGLHAYKEQHYEEAVQKFFDALGLRQDPKVYYYLADSLTRLQRFEEAKQYYYKVTVLSPTSTEATLSQIALDNIERYNRQYGTIQKLSDLAQTNNQPWRDDSDARELALLQKTIRDNGISPGESTGDSGNYVDKIATDGMYVRWPDSYLPLKVYIEPSKMESQYHTYALKALDAWCRATNNKIRYMEVNTPETANIRIQWVGYIGFKQIDGHHFLKEGTTQMKQKNQIFYQEIKIVTEDLNHKAHSPQTLYATLVHEFGHALGLRGHSDDPDDVMYFSKHEKETGRLTQRDINTIKQLYNMQTAQNSTK